MINKDYSILYDIITMDIINTNRMKSLYKNSTTIKTNGYQDFSNMLSVFGKN